MQSFDFSCIGCVMCSAVVDCAHNLRLHFGREADECTEVNVLKEGGQVSIIIIIIILFVKL